MTQWCTQVVRYRIGKRLEFLVGGLELRSALGQLLVELADLGIALLTLFELDLKPIACVAEVVLDPTANSTEGGNYECREHKQQKVWEVSRGNIEAVDRFHEKIAEHRRGQQNAHQGRLIPRIPGDKTDDEDEEWQLYIAGVGFLIREG